MSDVYSRFGINSYSYTLDHTAWECMAHLSSKGVKNFELMTYPGHLWPAELDAAAREELRRKIDASGLRVMTLNIQSLDLNLAAASVEMRNYTIDILSGMIRLAGDLGVPNVIIGPGKANPLYMPPREQLTDRFYAGLDILYSLAKDVGTGILVENVPVGYVPDADGLMKLLDDYGKDDIHIIYDVANGYFIKEDLREGLHRVKPRLKLVHASDTGLGQWKHDPVGTGTLPFETVPAILKEIDYTELPVLEIISYEGDAGVLGSMDRLAAIGW